MGLFAWIIIGLIAGAIASFIIQERTPGGIVGAIVIGLVGAVVGGWLAQVVAGAPSITGLNLYSVIIAILGSVILLAIARLVRTTT